jgi:hypothetical protein
MALRSELLDIATSTDADRVGPALPTPGRRRLRWRRLVAALGLVVALGLLVGHRELGSDPLLAIELLRMQHADQDARQQMAARVGPVNVGRELTDEQAAVLAQVEQLDRRHEARLAEIVDEHGWPGRSLVGRTGAHAAWLIAQHSRLDFQRRVLPLIENDAGATPAELAKLEDRIRVREGREQRYGTQWTCRDGRLELSTPVEGATRVDERRAAVGLGSLDADRRRILEREGPCLPGTSGTLWIRTPARRRSRRRQRAPPSVPQPSDKPGRARRSGPPRCRRASSAWKT